MLGLPLALWLASALVSNDALAKAGKNLEAIVTNSKLSTGLDDNPVVYDGQDSIYVLGGDAKQQIIKYSVANDQVAVVGKMPNDTYWGSAVWGGNGNIFYFGGRDSTYKAKSEVWGVNTKNPSNMTVLSYLPGLMHFASYFWDGGDNIYVIGGCTGSSYLDTITKYSIRSRQVNTAARIPFEGCLTSVVWNANAGVAYIFGGHMSNGDSKDILEFNPAQGTVVKLNATLPLPTGYSCAVWTGAEAYIIGGSTKNATNWSQIVRFNPSTNQVVEVDVKNFPERLRGCGCAYVEKLNRIYVLGGWDDVEYRSRDEIMFIDLGPNVPSTTTNTSSSYKFFHFNTLILIINFILGN